MIHDATDSALRPMERRRHDRVPVARPVRLQIAGREEVLAVTANVSPGGLFVECQEPPPVGTRVKFVLDLGSRAVRGFAEVAWVRLRFKQTDQPRGMGVRILHVLDDSARHLTDFIDDIASDRAG